MSEPTNPTTTTLRAARAQIADPAAWIKGSYGKIDPDDDTGLGRGHIAEATCFCAAGALLRVELDHRARYAAIHQLVRVLEPQPVGADESEEAEIIGFNDDPATTHADVLALFDRAIAASEATP